jgi:hypothetical protein
MTILDLLSILPVDLPGTPTQRRSLTENVVA